jgi:hypothetical protein
MMEVVMGQILTGKFIADGNDAVLDLKHIPAYLELFNANAVAGEVGLIKWWYHMGAAKELDIKVIADNGETGNENLTYETSAATIKETVESGTVQAVDPVQPEGKRGVKIDASFMEDGDEIYYFAVVADRDQDLGDAADW